MPLCVPHSTRLGGKAVYQELTAGVPLTGSMIAFARAFALGSHLRNDTKSRATAHSLERR